ncbi:MAG: hypothetical protein AAGA48_06545 [Myxococcota bacterium]
MNLCWLALAWGVPPEPPMPTVTPAVPEPSVDEVLASFDREPTVAEVQGWASRHAGTDPARIDQWLRQASRFAALPRTTLEWRFNDGTDQSFNYFDAFGDPLLPGVTPAGIIDQASLDRTASYRIRLDWDLGDLVMSSERIRVLNEAQDLVEFRDELLTEVTRLYFERRRLQVEQRLRPPVDVGQAAREALRLQELTARLDALTGGAFAAALARRPKGQ